MIKKIPHLAFIILLSIGIQACKPSQTVTKTDPNSLNNPALVKAPVWAPKKFNYNPSRDLNWDLLHTALEVKFDWEKKHLIGKATLTLKPWFYTQDSLLLDAKGFDIHSISIEGSPEKLNYFYDEMVIHIGLKKSYSRNENLKIIIDYTAKPDELDRLGSSAITDAKGLYFINADGSQKGKPQQIWTQGETESNSCWFPTIDSPNERTTQETRITVAKKFITLSNGKRVSQTENPDGTRTDVWVQSLPHAPYLFMLTIGEFAEIKDTWRNIEVNYYVDPAYGPHARAVFGHTPEMIEVYSNLLGVPYPWEKYSQVVVQDFVSGAMENTTAVIHYSGLQQDSREILDTPMDGIISHELFHHWFGDLVTCESWPNIPLNESFATYGEYLWLEHKNGIDAADKEILNKRSQYLGEAKGKREPLIRYYYNDKENMFDGHSYQKGGCVLHMLRKQVGDEAFFASLKLYLERNAYTSVEIHDLRLAFEDITGKDLSWFFNQWFMAGGHPELEVNYNYESGKLAIAVQQKQNAAYSSVFRFPVKIAAGSGSQYEVGTFEISSADTTLYLPLTSAPEGMIFDADKSLLCELNEDKSPIAWQWQLRNAKNFGQRMEAMNALRLDVSSAENVNLFFPLLNHSYSGTRAEALEILQMYEGEKIGEIQKIATEMALKDPSSKVRASALKVAFPDAQLKTGSAETEKILDLAYRDSSYVVQNLAMVKMKEVNPDKAYSWAKELAKNPAKPLFQGIYSILAEKSDDDAIAFLASHFPNMSLSMEKFQIIGTLTQKVENSTGETLNKYISLMKTIASEDAAWYIRMMAMNSLIDKKEAEGVRPFLEERLLNEKNEKIKEAIKKSL